MAASDIEGTFFIRPTTPVPAQTTFLPPGDQVGQTIIIPRIACFRRDESILSEERFIEALKRAVADTIADFPHLCGKITWANKATRRVQLEIPEDTTVQLVVKRQSHLTADELEAKNWPPYMLKRAELTLSKWPTYGIDTYNFAVQANLIKGGVLLAIHMNHVHLDGIGHVMVEMVFAHHLSRAVDGKPYKRSGIINDAALDKSLAWGSHPARPILEWEDWRKAGPPLEQPEGMTHDEFWEMLVATCDDFRMSGWKFTKETQETIRREGQRPGGKKLSLASCMHSFLWKVYVRARELEPEQETICFTPVQTRGRVKDLPQMWAGTALVYSRAKMTAQQVREKHAGELGEAIEAGTARWTEETIREFWGSIEDCPNLADVEPNVNRVRGPDVEFSNLSTFPFYRNSWGKGLIVKSWRVTELAFSDAYVVIAPKLNNGDIEFFLLATSDAHENILRDPEFRRHAIYVTSNDPDMEAEVERVTPKQPAPKSKL
jgi:hypothetical protein